jgi:hypothetical protein
MPVKERFQRSLVVPDDAAHELGIARLFAGHLAISV